MRLSENSLYKDSVERAAFLADKEKCANSLVYNYFAFLSLYSMSEKKAQMKRYLNNEKEVNTTDKIGDDNLDVSLAVKLAVECGGLPERTAKYMLKLLTKINQRTLLAKDIDDDAVRELVKYSKLQTTFRPAPALVSVINDFMDGTINLTFLAYGLFKFNKRFTDVNAEFVDYYKKGFYGTTYSDYVNGVIKAPDGVPQQLIKKTTALTVVYTKNMAAVQAQPQVQASLQQPAPVVQSVTPTPQVTQPTTQPTPLTVQPQVQPTAVVQQPTVAATPTVQQAPAITVSSVPVVGQKQTVAAKPVKPAYVYNDIVDIIEAGAYSVDLKKCDITGVQASFDNFNASNARVVAAIKKEYARRGASRTAITELFADMSKVMLAFSEKNQYKQFKLMKFLAAAAVAENMLTMDVSSVNKNSIMSSAIQHRNVKSFYNDHNHVMFSDTKENFAAFIAGTPVADHKEFYRSVCKLPVSVGKRADAIKFYSELLGVRDSGAAYIGYYDKAIDVSNLDVLISLYIGGLYTDDSDLLALNQLFDRLGLTGADIVHNMSGSTYVVTHSANPLDPAVVELTKVLQSSVFTVVSTHISTDSNKYSPEELFYSFVDSMHTIDVGGHTYTIENYICNARMTFSRVGSFTGLIDRIRFTINTIKTERGVTIDDSDASVGKIITKIFKRPLIDKTHMNYSIDTNLFSVDSLDNVDLAIVKDAIDIMGEALLTVDTNSWPAFFGSYTSEMDALTLYAPKTPAAAYYANKVAAALLVNKSVYNSNYSAYNNAIELMTLKRSRMLGAEPLVGSEALCTAAVLLTSFVKMVDSGGIAQTIQKGSSNGALSYFIQHKMKYDMIYRDELLSYVGSVPTYRDIVTRIDSYIEGFIEAVSESTTSAPDDVIDIIVFGKHKSYADATPAQIRNHRDYIIDFVQNAAISAKLFGDIMSSAAADSTVSDEQFNMMLSELTGGTRGGNYKYRQSGDALLLEVLSNPIYKERFDGLNASGVNVKSNFSTISSQLAGSYIESDVLGNKSTVDGTAEKLATISSMYGNNHSVKEVFSSSFNESTKMDKYSMNTLPIITSPFMLSVLNLVDVPTREYMFKRVNDLSASEARDAIINKDVYQTYNHDKLKALDLKKFGLTQDEAKLLLEIYVKFTVTAFSSRNETEFKQSYKGVLIMIGKLEDSFGITAKYTKASFKKLKEYGAEVVDFEIRGVTTKGRDAPLVHAKFTLNDMLDKKFPITPEEGNNKGSFSNAVRRNQPSVRISTASTLLPEFENATTHTQAITMIFEGNVFGGNDSQKLAQLRPLCVTPIDTTPKMLTETTDKLNTTRRERVHGLALPKVTKMFNVDFNMTNMDTKPHTKEAIDAFVASKNIDRNNQREYLKVCFHGTGSMAASFILRFGFKDTGVVVDGAGNAGQMLGDGMYLAVNIDKATLYAYDGGVSPDNFGEKGYIFICEAALGVRHKDYEYAAPDQPANVRSREWCVKTPTQQVWIKRAYGIDIVRRTKQQDGVGNSWEAMPDSTIEY